MSDERTHYHVGHPPPHVRHILDRIKRGLPVYMPTEPVAIDQTSYIRFAAKPEGKPKT